VNSTLTFRGHFVCRPRFRTTTLTIQLNGEPVELANAMTVSDLLSRYGIDARRVAVEHNLVVIKRAAYGTTLVEDGDAVEIVNFVGGG
jgi:thiamine biosynthesis protein ThiS